MLTFIIVLVLAAALVFFLVKKGKIADTNTNNIPDVVEAKVEAVKAKVEAVKAKVEVIKEVVAEVKEEVKKAKKSTAKKPTAKPSMDAKKIIKKGK